MNSFIGLTSKLYKTRGLLLHDTS